MVVCTYSFLYTVFILYCGCWYPFPVGMYVVVTLSNWLNIYIYISCYGYIMLDGVLHIFLLMSLKLTFY